MLNLLSYDFMQRAFLAVIAMSLFSPSSWNFSNLAPSKSHERHSQSRLALRVLPLAWFWGFLRPSQLLLLS